MAETTASEKELDQLVIDALTANREMGRLRQLYNQAELKEEAAEYALRRARVAKETVWSELQAAQAEATRCAQALENRNA